ncbi:MAG: site-specific integrase [Chlamydiia bacterium]|nr:site-specific integrase [Chlamydiia bacterium]
MAYIEKRTSADGKTKYRAQIRLLGFPQQTATFDRKTDAKRWAQRTEAAMKEGRYFKAAEAKKKTIGMMIDKYLSEELPKKPKNAYNINMQLLWWKEKIGYCLLSDITPALIGEHRDQLLQGKTPRGSVRSPSTVVRYLSALSHAFTVAVKEWGWLEDNPLRKVTKPRQPRGRVRFLDLDERTRLLEQCQASKNPFLYTVVVLAISTGMRQGEIMNLRWKDIDFEKDRITLYETKNGEIRVVPLMGLASKLLRELAAKRTIDTDLAFPSKKKSNVPMDLRSPWETALKKANVADFTFHDLRHSCASYMVMNGASLVEVADVLGHKDLQMAKRYSHLSEDHKKNAVADMNRKIFGY